MWIVTCVFEKEITPRVFTGIFKTKSLAYEAKDKLLRINEDLLIDCNIYITECE